MSSPSEENQEAINDLPNGIRLPLERFFADKSDANLTEVIKAVLNDFAPLPISTALSDSTNFIQDLGLDSLAITEFVFFFEDIFQLKITNEELADMRTVGELKTFLKSQIG